MVKRGEPVNEDKPFWETKTLHEMTVQEWESLCDGCAKCCLQKLQDDDTEEVYYTDIVCRYMNSDSCQCTQYEKRQTLVPNCVWLKPEDVESFHWLPRTCAYRSVYEGRGLPEWHPLITGDASSVHIAGVSVKGKVVSELCVPERDWQYHIIVMD